MNVKKMFASLAGVLMLAQAAAPMVTGAATYSDELQGAYDYAYSVGITTMSSIDNANMYGDLTRGQLSKMISQWAEKEMGVKADTTAVCSFTDTDTAEGDLATYVVKSCQMGLMGQGIEKFRPNDKVTRGEFGTVLSRAIWGDKYDGENPYYAKHLQALKDAGIMTNISDPNATEMRGWVMLMLERAAETVNPSECNDPAVLLACSLGSDSCPAACRNNDETIVDEDGNVVVVKSGDLSVSAERNEGTSVISNGATSELDTLTFQASEEITLKSVTLERYGYSTSSSVASIWLEDLDGNKVTAEKSLSASKDTVTLSLKKDYQTIKDGDKLVVVMTTANSKASELGKSIGFKIIEVDASAKNLNLSNYSANLYDIIDYSGTDAKVEFKGSDKTYNYEADKYYEVAKIKVTANNAAVLVNGFTLTQAADGTLDLNEFVDSVEVLVDGKAVDSKFSTKRDELRVSFDNQEIAINKNSTFTVNVALKDFDEFGTVVHFGLENASDVNVLESKNNVRVTVYNKSTGTPAVHSFDSTILAPKYTFDGGKINLTNVKLSSTIDAAAGSDDVVIAEGKIAIGGQAVRISSLKLEPSDAASTTPYASALVESIKFVVNGDEYEATANNQWTVKDVIIDEDSKIKVTVDIKDDVTGNFSIKVNGQTTSALSKSTLVVGTTSYIKYDDVSSTVATKAGDNLVGSISISKVNIQPAKGSLTINSTNKVEFKVLETNEKTVFKGTYTAKKDGNVNLDHVTIWKSNTDASQAVPTNSDISFTVRINGDDVATITNPKVLVANTYSGEEADFSPITVKAGESVSVEVIANIYASQKTTNNLEYKIKLSGKDDASNEAGNAEKGLAPIAFVDNSSINVATNAAMKKQDVVLANKDQNLATFIVKPSNKATTANLDQLDFTLGATLQTLVQSFTSSSADDLFEVVIGDQTADNVYFGTKASHEATAAATKLVVEDINMDIEGEVVVKVNFKEKLAAGGKANATTYTSKGTYTALTSDTTTVYYKLVGTTYTEVGKYADLDSSDTTTTYYTKDPTTYAANSVYELTLSDVNAKGDNLGTSYVFKRTAVNSLVRVKSMNGNKDSDTKYVFEIAYSDDANSETIQSVTFDYGSSRTAGDGQYEAWQNVQDGNTYTAPNMKDTVYYVNNIEWIDGDNYKVSLPYIGNEDFFKTNGSNEDRLRAYADD